MRITSKYYERSQQLRDILGKNVVVVLPRDVIHPWDNVPSFDFLECNLTDISKNPEGYKKKKTAIKDTFVGSIN